MHLRRVVLHNIKCFSHLEIDFLQDDGQPRMWTTILGENGLGKTAILQAIGAALIGPQATLELKPIMKDWIKNETNSGSIEYQIQTTTQDPLIENFPQSTPNPSSHLVFESENTEETFLINGRSSKSAGDHQYLHIKNHLYSEKVGGWLACGYGPFRRLSGGSNDAENILKSGRKSARMLTLFREDAALTDARAWLIALHNTAREGDTRNAARLGHVREALRENLLPQPAALLTSASSARLKIGDREPVEFDELSDGYRSMLALGIDLLRWLTQAFPDAEEPMKCPGVVLIDELDAHLHPTWQRHIGFWLRAKFPHLQFIVATHSPFLAQVADEGGNLILIERDGQIVIEQDPRSVASWQVDQILTTLFGLESTRAPMVEEKLARHDQLSIKAKDGVLSADETVELAELEQWRETLPFPLSDPQQRRLASLLHKTVGRFSDRLSELE